MDEGGEISGVKILLGSQRQAKESKLIIKMFWERSLSK